MTARRGGARAAAFAWAHPCRGGRRDRRQRGDAVATIVEFALGASLYFGELIVETPFVHSGTISEKFRPTEHPRSYHLEFLKAVAFFLDVMPLVDNGLINLIPDPWTFDYHLRRETMAMAEERSAGIDISFCGEPRLEKLMRTDFRARHADVAARRAGGSHAGELP